MAGSLTESNLNEEELQGMFLEAEDEEDTGLWVFGYGSLCWHQGFEYDNSLTGFVQGFSRKFWQGNTTHRGTENKPGRVATLIEDAEGIVWGQAFRVKDEKALPYLYNRECELGGYMTTITTFFPRRDQKKLRKPFPVVLYVATPRNKLWLGDSPLGDIANQIVECKGDNGYNVEYLLRLANFVRENIPEAVDEHLFKLELLVRALIVEKNLCLEVLMGENTVLVNENENENENENKSESAREENARVVTTNNKPFADMVPSKRLRCVNI